MEFVMDWIQYSRSISGRLVERRGIDPKLRKWSWTNGKLFFSVLLVLFIEVYLYGPSYEPSLGSVEGTMNIEIQFSAVHYASRNKCHTALQSLNYDALSQASEELTSMVWY